MSVTGEAMPRVLTWANHDRVETGIDASNGVIFQFGDGTWVELIWRKSDNTLSLSADCSLIIRPVASNTARIGVER